MKKTITVVYNNTLLSICKPVAERLKLSDGYLVRTEAEFWEILSANCSFGLSMDEHKLNTKDN